MIELTIVLQSSVHKRGVCVLLNTLSRCYIICLLSQYLCTMPIHTCNAVKISLMNNCVVHHSHETVYTLDCEHYCEQSESLVCSVAHIWLYLHIIIYLGVVHHSHETVYSLDCEHYCEQSESLVCSVAQIWLYLHIIIYIGIFRAIHCAVYISTS